MEHTTVNFTLDILNQDAYWDYRSACKITQGYNVDRSCHCMNPMYDKCMCKSLENKRFCSCNECPMNMFHNPKDWGKYWKRQLVALHSPIRMIHFTITDLIPRSVAMQLVRHTLGHPQPFVQSSRPDWTGKPRSADPNELKWCKFLFTPESFLYMCHKRLCMRTEENTRKVVEAWVNWMRDLEIDVKDDGSFNTKSDRVMIHVLGEIAAPKCEVNGLNKCVELFSCGKHEHV